MMNAQGAIMVPWSSLSQKYDSAFLLLVPLQNDTVVTSRCVQFTYVGRFVLVKIKAMVSCCQM